MGLRGDFDEVARVWRSSPWRVRLYLGLSAFLASTSIASLSDAVFKWKSFLLDGVNFYREHIAQPVVSLFTAMIGQPPPPAFADHLVTQVAVLAAFLRYKFYLHRDVKTRVIELAWATFLLLATVLPVARSSSLERDLFPLYMYAVMVAVFILFAKGAARLLAVAWLLIPPLLVCMLAAINAGIHRTAA